MALADATILHQLKIHNWIVVEYISYFLLQMAAVFAENCIKLTLY